MSVITACAGHILGAVSLSIDIGGKRVTFSGDVGRYDTPILPDPQGLEIGDLLLCESTYGDRIHAAQDSRRELAMVINKAASLNGPIIIPAFAVGRTQNLLYQIAELERDGLVPILPVYVDSPMAINATNIYRSFRHDYDEEAKELLEVGETPLLTENTVFCKSVESSKSLNELQGSRIIISASGMVTGGRVLHHMIQWLGNEDTTVLFVGFQANGTRGSIIQSGAKEVKIFGKYVRIRANIETISGLSAHGDREELLRWLGSCTGVPAEVKVVHGEPESSRAFAFALESRLDWKAKPAEYLETVEI
ncbi:hypothetical protein BVY02_00145 [bacterium J17]|nr:hypothetical protein BVY02_00145 [bacterium J17]